MSRSSASAWSAIRASGFDDQDLPYRPQSQSAPPLRSPVGEGDRVFLRSLTLKGFKSFADKTTLDFEPGVCVVVGPNGSGKSNVVDSVAWVLGAQGARALRGGKMDDVIFAGTAERPALGRAEVSLTIDNTAGLLPIEFSEVTITRTLFRTGESEYMINGAPCRLLDIQELMSDTGIGRQQHVIVGQGQIDAVLNARPEERRAIIEEAAGILKFRKRREKAQRRLEATEGNLLRLTDLLREVRRQLRPLERQADAARRHDGIVAELRAVTLHLAGREIERQQTRVAEAARARAQLVAVDADAQGLSPLRTEVEVAEARASELRRVNEHVLAQGELPSARTRRAAEVEVADAQREIDQAGASAEAIAHELVQVRSELTDVDAQRAGIEPSRAEAQHVDAAAAALRAEVEARAAIAPELTDESRALRTAEDAVLRADTEWRNAMADASHWRARADTLALALE